MTVQGETISNQFANKINASYNLEMFVSSTAKQVILGNLKEDKSYLHKTLDTLVNKSRMAYREFLDNPDFIEFFSHATPIDVLEQSKIGSRPARRTGKRSLNDLRSIPWVFSWNQSRYNLTGWFGTGQALKQFENEHLKFEVHDMCKPYHKTFDAVFNLFTSFGYFENDEDNLKTLKAIKANLNDTGFGVIDFMNTEYVIKNLVAKNTKTVDGIDFHQTRIFEDGYILKINRHGAALGGIGWHWAP